MKAKTLAPGTALIVSLIFLCAPPASAQTETWIHATPHRVVPEKVSVYTCLGQTHASINWVFNDGGYRVAQPPAVSRSGQRITLDVRAEEWTGARTLSIVYFDKTFDLGLLEPGTYTLDVRSWGTSLKEVQFTIPTSPAPANSLDEPCFLVSQHYRDFLSREPDGAGFAFWTNEISKCGADAHCREVKRINTSAAFFFSIEFRETGYFVYRLFKAALGRAPTFEEFGPATAAVGNRVVVGSSEPWVMRLDWNKSTFASAFAGRQDFQARYGAMTDEQYVDALFQTAGVTPARAERDELINGLTNCPYTIGCPTRATVLRKVAEHAALDRKVFNDAFVTMQYFGYLRRDPDEAGFQFWRDKLEQFNGNFVAAEMVKAFLDSAEYRQRFGQ